MEKRIVLFVLLSIPIVVGYQLAVNYFYPPEAEVAQEEVVDEAADEGSEDGAEKAADAAAGVNEEVASGEDEETAIKPATTDTEDAGADDAAEAAAEEPPAEPRWVALGSISPDSPFRMLTIIASRGAAVERVELAPLIGDHLQYDIEVDAAYLGHLAWTHSRTPEGLKVNVVGAGTPAALAKPEQSGVGTGLRTGDVVVSLDGKRIANLGDLNQQLLRLRPGATVKVEVDRPIGGKNRRLEFQVALTRRPVNVIRPEPVDKVQPTNLSEFADDHDLSLLVDLATLGDKKVGERVSNILRTEPWRIVDGADESGNSKKKTAPDSVEFRKRLRGGAATGLPAGVDLEFVKRFRLARKKTDSENAEKPVAGLNEAFHLVMEIEIENLGNEPQRLSYALQGPTGMTREGWWYSTKIHPGFSAAGARDIVWRTEAKRFNLRGATHIYKAARKAREYEDEDEPEKAEEELAENSLFVKSDEVEARQINFVGVDTQYFACMILPGELLDQPPSADKPHMTFERLQAVNLAPLDDDDLPPRRADVTFQLVSTPQTIEPNEKLQQSLVVFVGPKDPPILVEYGLRDVVYYGWFGWVSKPLLAILHFFHGIVPNYAVAIILLTVLVRSCMLPLSMKTARNAAMMQSLAPEMKKIAEKYKNDLQKRSEAQRELFAKHKYNPLGGCWMMFVQLPIFLGLYRGLAVDIDLRGQPLIPGVDWASNLAAPDMLLHWGDWPFMPDFLVGENGYLGPYLNFLPLITVGLFLWQQKLFAPPATDEQTRMQLKVMNFMTIFMGVMFFRVPAGLCIYFITSSMWGITERLLLKKVNKKRTGGDPVTVSKPAPKPTPKPKPKPSPGESRNGGPRGSKPSGQKERRR